MTREYFAVARLLHSAGCNLNDNAREICLSRTLPYLGYFSSSSYSRVMVHIDPKGLQVLDDLATFVRYQVLDEDPFAADGCAEELLDCIQLGADGGLPRIIHTICRINLLCHLGANAGARHESGQQPLHLLLSRLQPTEKKRYIVFYQAMILIRFGSDIWACDDNGNTPCSLAMKHGHWKSWCAALKICGRDVEAVLTGQRELRWNRQHLNDATRSGADTQDLESPEHKITTVRRRGAFAQEVDE